MVEENHYSNTEEAVQEPIEPDEEISDNSDDVPLKYLVHLVRVNEKLFEMEETSSTTKKCPRQG